MNSSPSYQTKINYDSVERAQILMNAKNSRTIIYVLAFAKIRQEVTFAAVPRVIDSDQTAGHVKVIF